jgi:hypothetical protein
MMHLLQIYRKNELVRFAPWYFDPLMESGGVKPSLTYSSRCSPMDCPDMILPIKTKQEAMKQKVTLILISYTMAMTMMMVLPTVPEYARRTRMNKRETMK